MAMLNNQRVYIYIYGHLRLRYIGQNESCLTSPARSDPPMVLRMVFKGSYNFDTNLIHIIHLYICMYIYIYSCSSIHRFIQSGLKFETNSKASQDGWLTSSKPRGAIGILPWRLNQIQEDMHVRDLVVDGLLWSSLEGSTPKQGASC